MKIILSIIFLILFNQSNITAEESSVQPQDNIQQNESVFVEEAALQPHSFNYFNFSSSFYFQSLGMGRQMWNAENTRAHDINFNARFFVFSISNDLVVPNFKYKYLKRSTKNPDKYFGVGLELGAAFRWSKGDKGVYPNIELIWGRERKKIHFTQFSINLLPVAVTVTGLGYGLINGCSGCDGLPVLFGVLAVPAIFEYTIAF